MIKREDKKMIKDMTLQPYPLWAVEDGDDTVLLVLGWIAVKETVMPVLAMLDTVAAEPFVADRMTAIYADRPAAELAARANAERQG